MMNRWKYFFFSQVSEGLIFVVALYDVVVVGKGLDPLVYFFGAQVARAEDWADFVGSDHVFVLCGDFKASLGDVEVPEDKCELSHLLFFGHCLAIDIEDLLINWSIGRWFDDIKLVDFVINPKPNAIIIK